MADNSLADILILAILCLAGIGSAAYVVLRRLQRVEERALGDVELQDLKRDEDLTFEGQVVKGDVPPARTMSSLRDAVRDKLREDKVKLWLPPYDDASKVDALAKAYAAALQAPEPDVAAHLADLRQSALAKLAQRTLITLQGTNFSVRVSTELPGAARARRRRGFRA